jgi:hypothetical protein
MFAACVVNSAVSAADSDQTPVSVSNAVSIPFDFVSDRVMVRTRVNGSEPVSLMLDTGYSINMLSPSLMESLALKRAGRVTIVGIAGEEPTEMFEGASFDLGGAKYSPRRVAALPASYQRRWRKRDGILGAGFFRRFVVAIDPKARTITLHAPDAFRYSGEGEIIPFKFKETVPVVEGVILLPGHDPIQGRFEIDTGCDGGLCLGSEFVRDNHLLEGSGGTKGAGRTGVGGDAGTRVGRVPQFRLGRLVVEKPLTNFFLDGSPVDAGYAGHIGMEVFRRFKVIFDYSRQRIILEREGG